MLRQVEGSAADPPLVAYPGNSVAALAAESKVGGLHGNLPINMVFYDKGNVYIRDMCIIHFILG